MVMFGLPCRLSETSCLLVGYVPSIVFFAMGSKLERFAVWW